MEERRGEVADFSEAVRLTPWDWQRRCTSRGLAQLARKQYEQAVADFTEATRLAPEQPEAYRQRAVAHVQLGQVERAIEDLLGPDPDQPACGRSRTAPEPRLHLRRRDYAAAGGRPSARRRGLDLGQRLHAPRPGVDLGDRAWGDSRRQASGWSRARKACELECADWKSAECLVALAAAAPPRWGVSTKAVQWAESVPWKQRIEGDRPAYQKHLEAYRQGQPWRRVSGCSLEKRPARRSPREVYSSALCVLDKVASISHCGWKKPISYNRPSPWRDSA